jgi:hypothetical protein
MQAPMGPLACNWPGSTLNPAGSYAAPAAALYGGFGAAGLPPFPTPVPAAVAAAGQQSSAAGHQHAWTR